MWEKDLMWSMCLTHVQQTTIRANRTLILSLCGLCHLNKTGYFCYDWSDKQQRENQRQGSSQVDVAMLLAVQRVSRMKGALSV